MKIRKIRRILMVMVIVGLAGFIYFYGGLVKGVTASPVAAEITLKKDCIRASIRGIELEIAQCQSWIDLREQKKVNDPDSLPGLKADLQALKADLQKYQAIKPEDYQLPEKVQTNAWVEGTPGENSILYVDGMFKSGPWYHMTGIIGDNFKVLKSGNKYKVTFYKVYPRNYFNMPSSYVYIANY